MQYIDQICWLQCKLSHLNVPREIVVDVETILSFHQVLQLKEFAQLRQYNPTDKQRVVDQGELWMHRDETLYKWTLQYFNINNLYNKWVTVVFE